MAWDSAWQRLGQKADAVPSGRGKGAQEREERGAYFWGTHRPRRRAVFSRPFRASVTSQSAVGEAVRRILSGRSKDFLTVPMICDIHFPAMQNPLFHRSPARKVLGAQRRRIGGLARAWRSGLGARAASSSWISPSPPSDGGEGWGAEGRFYWFPLSSVLSPLVPRGERMESLMQPCLRTGSSPEPADRIKEARPEPSTRSTLRRATEDGRSRATAEDGRPSGRAEGSRHGAKQALTGLMAYSPTHWLRACFKNRPVRGPGLQGFRILAISRRPRALTRRPPTISKHALMRRRSRFSPSSQTKPNH